jgi:C4-dicarboxylate transporter DctQ subunit
VVARINSLLAKLDKFGRLTENALLVILLGTMVFIGVAQIVLREVFETSIIWADDLVKLIVLWLAMVGAVAATRDDRHIRIDALSHLLTEKVVAGVRLLVDLFAAVVCAVIAWNSWLYLQVEIEYEVTVLTTVDAPAWLAHVVLPVAFALISYRFLVLFLGGIVGLISGEETAE